MIQPGLPPKVTPPPPPAPKPSQSQTNIKDTIESILVAFILAFIFRAFVVEAFVIPTGSMAPTLLGAHMRFYCPDCGYKFTANYTSPNPQGDDVFVPDEAEPVEIRKGVLQVRSYPIHCPNCGYKLPQSETTSPPVHHGDRILVMKYLYLFEEPKRWDVVVFKSPDDPKKYDYTQNYIKRLVGRPNEVILIIDGDIYVAPNTGREPLPGEYKVQRKPADVQNALWRVIYDNDFHPRGLSRFPAWRQPWTPVEGAGWDQSGDGGRTFRFNNATAGSTLRFEPSAAMSEVSPFYDFLAYDQTYWPSPIRLPHLDPRIHGNLYEVPLAKPGNVVADLKLSATYQRHSGDGPMRLQLFKEPDLFTAEFLPDKVRLLCATGTGNPVVVGEAPGQWDRPTRVELQNIDYRASVIIDGKEVLATGTEYAPDVAAMLNSLDSRSKPLPNAQIVAERQDCTINHISLNRDIYYINAEAGAEQSRAWANPRNPMVLGPDEYFVCGDNSLISGDARVWGRPINLPYENLHVDSGRVPRRFMLGKAFFVYWPAGYRPLPGLPGLAPNFGEMRFIH